MTRKRNFIRALVFLAVFVPAGLWGAGAEELNRPKAAHVPVFKQVPGPIPEGPGQPLSLSLEQAVFLALKNNRDLQIQQLAPVIAGTYEQIELGVFDPALFADLSWGREMDDADSQDRLMEAQAGITKQFTAGTTLTAGMAYEKDSSEDSGSRHNTRAQISITQALLKGRGAVVTLIGVKQRELDTLATVYQLEGFTQALVAQTETAYWHHVLAVREIEIFQRSLEVAAQQRDEVEQQIGVGVLPRNEAAAALAEEAIREQALINAASLVEDRRLALLQIINAQSPDTALETVSVPAVHGQDLDDHQQRVDLAIKSRPDLKEAGLKLARNDLDLVATQNGLLPRLDFFMDLAVMGYGNSLGESIENISTDSYDINAGIHLSRSMGNREAKARFKAATVTKAQAQIAMDNLRHTIRYQVSLAVNEVNRTRQQIFASRKTREYEEKTVVSEQERFKVGAGTSLLVAQAQRDLLASRIAEVRAVISYRIALVNLFLAEGSLLQRRGIFPGTDH